MQLDEGRRKVIFHVFIQWLAHNNLLEEWIDRTVDGWESTEEWHRDRLQIDELPPTMLDEIRVMWSSWHNPNTGQLRNMFNTSNMYSHSTSVNSPYHNRRWYNILDDFSYTLTSLRGITNARVTKVLQD